MRHHRIFLELANLLETMSLRPGVADPDIPYLDFDRTSGEAVLDLTETLLEGAARRSGVEAPSA